MDTNRLVNDELSAYRCQLTEWILKHLGVVARSFECGGLIQLWLMKAVIVMIFLPSGRLVVDVQLDVWQAYDLTTGRM